MLEVLRVVGNGLATSSRLHLEATKPCVWCGARRRDKLEHMLVCRRRIETFTSATAGQSAVLVGRADLLGLAVLSRAYMATVHGRSSGSMHELVAACWERLQREVPRTTLLMAGAILTESVPAAPIPVLTTAGMR